MNDYDSRSMNVYDVACLALVLAIYAAGIVTIGIAYLVCSIVFH